MNGIGFTPVGQPPSAVPGSPSAVPGTEETLGMTAAEKKAPVSVTVSALQSTGTPTVPSKKSVMKGLKANVFKKEFWTKDKQRFCAKMLEFGGAALLFVGTCLLIVGIPLLAVYGSGAPLVGVGAGLAGLGMAMIAGGLVWDKMLGKEGGESEKSIKNPLEGLLLGKHPPKGESTSPEGIALQQNRTAFSAIKDLFKTESDIDKIAKIKTEEFDDAIQAHTEELTRTASIGDPKIKELHKELKENLALLKFAKDLRNLEKDNNLKDLLDKFYFLQQEIKRTDLDADKKAFLEKTQIIMNAQLKRQNLDPTVVQYMLTTHTSTLEKEKENPYLTTDQKQLYDAAIKRQERLISADAAPRKAPLPPAHGASASAAAAAPAPAAAAAAAASPAALAAAAAAAPASPTPDSSTAPPSPTTAPPSP